MQNHSYRRPLIIVSKEAKSTKIAGVFAHWDSFDVPHGEYSIPQLVDDHAEEIKKEYLTFVYELGKCKIRGKTLEEHLLIRERFSFWWLSLITEKHFQRSPGIYDAFRVRAIESLFYKEKCDGVILFSDNRLLHKTLKLWCKKIDVFYSCQFSEGKQSFRNKFQYKNLLRKFPREIIAIINLFRLLFLKRLFIFGGETQMHKRKPSRETVTIVSYFPNMDMKKAKQGYFRSFYWNNLHDLFEEGKHHINWVFIFGPDNNCRNTEEALEFQQKFIKNHPNQTFSFIEQWFSLRVFFETFKLFLLLRLRVPKFSNVKSYLVLPNSKMPIYPLLEHDWKESFSGWPCMNECLYFILYEALADDLSHQRMGLYLLENNTWERGLIYAWQSRNQTPIIGYQHSAMRELDMRFYADDRTYQDKSVTSMPLPTLMAVNGEGAYRLAVKWGYPEDRLIKVEALRYLYLNRPSVIIRKKTEGWGKLLLVVADISPESNIFLIKLLNTAFVNYLSNKEVKILIKPHPSCSIDDIIRRHAPDLSAEFTHKSLTEIWPEVDWIFSANNTTCGLEAVILGLPVIIAHDPDNFNINPLRGYSGVRFIKSAQDLLKALNAKEQIMIPENYFYLNEDLKNWRLLLSGQQFNKIWRQRHVLF